MSELEFILKTGDEELLEEFFLESGFTKYSSNIAKNEFTKAYQQMIKEKKNVKKKNTKTKNIK